MKIGNFELILSSRFDKEYLVAEISFDNIYWAEIFQENGNLEIQFYPHPNLPYWEFDLNEALEVLAKAKQKLVATGPKR